MKTQHVAMLCLFGSLWAAAAEGRYCGPEPTNIKVWYGDVVGCVIDHAGDTDIFRLTVSADEKIVLLLRFTLGDSGCFELLDPSGSPTPNGGLRCGNVSRIEETVDAPGVYSILVQSNEENQYYTLAVDRLNPVSPWALPLCYDCIRHGTIFDVGDIDFWMFNGSTGDSVNVTVTEDFGGNVCVELIDPAGAHTPNGGYRCGSSIRIDENPTATGTHAVMLTAPYTADYSITLQCTGTCPDPPSLCPLTTATGHSVDVLASVYRFRDDVMAHSERGRELTELFYRHATEGSVLMFRHPELRRQTADVLARIQPYLDEMVAGDVSMPSPDDERAIMSLMRAFYVKASPELRPAIVHLHGELRSGRLFSFVGQTDARR